MNLLQKVLESRAAIIAKRDALLAKVEGENRTNLTTEEETEFRGYVAELEPIDVRVAELREQEQRDQEAAAAASLLERGVTATGVRVRREPMTYERGNPRVSYFRDLGLAHVGGDEEARKRLARHREEMDVEIPAMEARKRAAFERALDDLSDEKRRATYERRDITRVDGAGGEFVPPLWLIDQYGEFLRAGRPFADACRQIPLPQGTDSINIPRITTGTSTAAQTADNAAVSETDIVTTSVSGPVRTIAGQQDIALQLLEQSPIVFDEVIFGDLTADYNKQVDTQCLNGSGSSGQHTGALQLSGTNSTTYTDVSPTVPELYLPLAQTLSLIASNRFMPPSAWFMHPRRWYWMLSALDSSNRPLVVPFAQGPYMALGVQTAVEAEGGPAGSVIGLNVTLDANIPTTLGGGTEDAVVAARMMDLLLFEGAIRTRALPEVLSGTLTVRLQLYAYSAFICGRQPKAIGKVTGTGLAAPSGF